VRAARARRIETRDRAIGGAQEAMTHAAAVGVEARNIAGNVDALRLRALHGARSRAVRIDRHDRSIRRTPIALERKAAVEVEARDAAPCIEAGHKSAEAALWSGIESRDLSAMRTHKAVQDIRGIHNLSRSVAMRVEDDRLSPLPCAGACASHIER